MVRLINKGHTNSLDVYGMDDHGRDGHTSIYEQLLNTVCCRYDDDDV